MDISTSGFLTAVETAATFFLVGFVLFAVIDSLGEQNTFARQMADSVKLAWTLLGLAALIGLPTAMKHWGNIYLIMYMAGTFLALALGFMDLFEFIVTNGTGVSLLILRFGDGGYV